ncbi:cytochrome P450 [Gordonia sinesedis]
MSLTDTAVPSTPPVVPLPTLAGVVIFATGSARAKSIARKRYGDAFGVKLPGLGRCVVIGDVDLIRQCHRADPTVLHAANSIGPVLGGHSLFSLDEDEHLHQRKLLMPSFNGAKLRAHRTIMAEEAVREVATWPVDEEFAVLPSMNRVTINIILRTIFGANYGGEAFLALRDRIPIGVRNGQLLALVPPLRRDLGPRSPGRRHREFRKLFDDVVDGLIDTARADLDAGRERSDILSLLLDAHYDDGTTLSRDDLADNLLALVVAGYETTAGTLAWALERVTRHPELLARLTEEARSGGDDLRIATITETQRTRPVVPTIARHVIRPFELGPWVLQPGTKVIIEAPFVHDDEDNYDDAMAFEPDRFVGRKVDTTRWIPFGGGVRRCLGAAFAQTEMDVVLHTVLSTIDLEATTAPDEKGDFRGVTYIPGDGGRIRGRRVPA